MGNSAVVALPLLIKSYECGQRGGRMKSLIGLVGAIALSGCASAQAFAYDPKDDVHCSVLSFYMHGRAKHIGSPIKERQALYALQAWYAAEVQDTGGLPPAEKVEPVLAAVKRHPEGAKAAVLACADRAQAAPGFGAFYKVAAAKYLPDD